MFGHENKSRFERFCKGKSITKTCDNSIQHKPYVHVIAFNVRESRVHVG